MSRTGSQERTLLGLVARLRPFWRSDAALHLRIDALIRAEKKFGSRDRKFYREMAYTALRYLPWVEPLLERDAALAVRRMAWLSSPLPFLEPFRSEVLGDWPPCPATSAQKAAFLGESVDALTPGWLAREYPPVADEPLRDVLLSRAPLWVRLQGNDDAACIAEFDRLGWAWARSPLCPRALRLPQNADVLRTESHARGLVEVQDVGSQRVLATVEVAPGGHWLDACAGAGGKSLQLAELLGPAGRVTVRDTREEALEELGQRARRSGLAGRIRRGPDPEGGYDAVLVDAPCTGSGTWRRQPHLRWATAGSAPAAFAATQLGLLREHAGRVRPGGLLVYATCSLCTTENEAVAEAFLGENRAFTAAGVPRRLFPQEHDGDGFFVAAFRRS